MVPITHEQNIICSKTRLDGTTHEQTIICRQLFAGHVVGSRPMERKKKMHQMIIVVVAVVVVVIIVVVVVVVVVIVVASKDLRKFRNVFLVCITTVFFLKRKIQRTFEDGACIVNSGTQTAG